MKKIILRVLSFVFCFAMILSLTVTTSSEPERTEEGENIEAEEQDFTDIYPDQDFEEGVVLVCFKPGTYDLQYEFTKEDFPELDVSRVENISKLTNEKMLADVEVQETYIHIIKVYLQDESPDGVIQALAKLNPRSKEDIQSAEPDYICECDADALPSDPHYSDDQADYYSKMSFQTAWATQTGSSQIKVAVLDCGVFDHEDLTLEEGISPYSSSTGGYYPATHGTSVAGIIGANWNSIGVAGTNRHVSLYPVTLDWYHDSDGIHFRYNLSEYSEIFTELNNQEIHIANMSLSGTGYHTTQESAIKNYFGLVVCSAGNNNYSIDTTPRYPACYDSDNIISVMGTRVYSDGEKRKFAYDGFSDRGSNFGANNVDIAALWDSYTTSVSTTNTSTYDHFGGTSAAAPYVSGAAALVWATKPELSALEVKQILMETADHLSTLEGLCVCEGRLNAGAAVTQALNYSRHVPKTLTGNFNGAYGNDIFESRALNNRRFLTLDLGSSISSNGRRPAVTTQMSEYFASGDPVYVGNVNGDQYDDVIVQYVSNGYRAFVVYEGKSSTNGFENGIKTITNNIHDTSQFPCVSFTGDFNNDSRTDFLVQYRAQNGTRTNLVYLGQTNGKFGIGIKTTSSRTYVTDDPVFVGDFNGDSYDDVLVHWVANGKRQLLVYYSNGNGGFGTPVNNPTTNSENSNYVSQYFVGDFNGDGYDDFLVHWSYSSGGTRNFILYPGSSSGLSGTGKATATNSNYVAGDPIFIGDVNNDGRDDVVVHWVSYGYRCMNTYLGKADGHFTNAVQTTTSNTHNTSTYPTRLLLMDYNGDGYDDMVAIWTGATKIKRIYIYKGQYDGSFSSGYLIKDGLMYYFSY